MKLILLDIDGVLNSQDNADALYEAWEIRRNHNKDFISKEDYENFRDGIYKDDFGVLFDPRCELWLNSLIQRTGAKIIISSDWRKSGHVAMENLWKQRGLYGEVIHCTPIGAGGMYETREEQIMLMVNHYKPETWVAIDDMDLDLPKTNFVRTDFYTGLNRITYHKAKNILLNKQ